MKTYNYKITTELGNKVELTVRTDAEGYFVLLATVESINAENRLVQIEDDSTIHITADGLRYEISVPADIAKEIKEMEYKVTHETGLMIIAEIHTPEGHPRTLVGHAVASWTSNEVYYKMPESMLHKIQMYSFDKAIYDEGGIDDEVSKVVPEVTKGRKSHYHFTHAEPKDPFACPDDVNLGSEDFDFEVWDLCLEIVKPYSD